MAKCVRRLSGLLLFFGFLSSSFLGRLLFCGLLCFGLCFGSLSSLGRFSLCFHRSLEVCESGEITEGGLLYLRQVESGFFSLSGFLSCLRSCLLALLPSAGCETRIRLASRLKISRRMFGNNQPFGMTYFPRGAGNNRQNEVVENSIVRGLPR